jgi:hypothetical protein
MAGAQVMIDANVARPAEKGLGRLAAWCYDHRRRGPAHLRPVSAEFAQWSRRPRPQGGTAAAKSRSGILNGAIKMPNSPDQTSRAQPVRRR